MSKLLFTMMMPFAFCGAVTAQTWISFYVSNAVEISAQGNKSVTLIPLKLENSVEWKNVSLKYPRPLYVKLNNRFDENYLNAFTIAKVDSSVPSIRVEVDLSKLRQQGTYQMEIVFANQGKSELPLQLNLTRPAATLDTVDPITISIEGDKVATSDPLVLREKGRVSDISGMYLRSPRFRKVGRNDTIVLTNPYFVTAGNSSEVNFQLTESLISKLPLDKSTGILEIAPPEMSSPMVITFEVTKRRAKEWIVLCIFLGLLFGAFVRHFLQRKKQSEESKLKAYGLIDLLTRERNRVEDEDFRADVAAMIDDLNREVNQHGSVHNLFRPGNGLEEKIKSLLTQYETLKTDFAGEVKKAKEQWEKNSACLESTYLTPYFTEKLKPAKNSHALAKENLLRGNPRQALHNTANVTVECKRLLQSYADTVEQMIKGVEGPETFYPDPITEAVKKRIETALVRLKADLTKLKAADPVECKEIFLADDMQVNLAGLLAAVQQEVSTRQIAMLRGRQPEATLLAAFQTASEKWKAALEAKIANPEARIEEGVVKEFTAHWKKIEALPQEAHYSTGPQNLQTPSLSYLERNSTGQSSVFSGTVPAPEPIHLRIRRAQKNWFFYAFLQTFALSVIVGLIAYRLYGSSFIGKTEELITIFLFAFGIDITVENVLPLRDAKL